MVKAMKKEGLMKQRLEFLTLCMLVICTAASVAHGGSTESVVADLRLGKSVELAQFCDENVRQVLALGVPSSNPEKWLLSMSPDPKTRLLALTEDYRKLDFPIPIYSDAAREIKGSIKDRGGDTLINSINSKSNRFLACSLLTLTHVQSCAESLRLTPEIMAVDSMTGFALGPLFLELATEDRYRTPLIEVARLLLNKVDIGDSSQDIFSDIAKIAQESGLPLLESRSLAWKIMGLYGSAGANMYLRNRFFGIQQNNPAIANALNLIASAIPYLDSLAKLEHRRYALPRGLQATCDQGKSYHFWMAAFLARELTLRGSSPQGAAAAAYSAEKGYQLFSNTAGRDPAKIFQMNEFYPITNTIRMDLVYAGSGAIFGASDAVARDYRRDLDEVIRLMFKSAASSPQWDRVTAMKAISEKSPKAYWYWSRMLTPDTGYRALTR